MKNQITCRSVKSNDQVVNLSVASKLPTSRIILSQEINSPDSLSVANKVSEDIVKQPDDKWITVVLTKTKKCQPAARETLSSCHTLHTVVVPVSWHTTPGHTLHTVVVPVQYWSHRSYSSTESHCSGPCQARSHHSYSSSESHCSGPCRQSHFIWSYPTHSSGPCQSHQHQST